MSACRRRRGGSSPSWRAGCHGSPSRPSAPRSSPTCIAGTRCRRGRRPARKPLRWRVRRPASRMIHSSPLPRKRSMTSGLASAMARRGQCQARRAIGGDRLGGAAPAGATRQHDRHRNQPAGETGQEGDHEVEAAGKHQEGAVARLRTPQQRSRQRMRAAVQLGERQLGLFRAAIRQEHVGAVVRLLDRPAPQQIDDRRERDAGCVLTIATAVRTGRLIGKTHPQYAWQAWRCSNARIPYRSAARSPAIPPGP